MAATSNNVTFNGVKGHFYGEDLMIHDEDAVIIAGVKGFIYGEDPISTHPRGAITVAGVEGFIYGKDPISTHDERSTSGQAQISPRSGHPEEVLPQEGEFVAITTKPHTATKGQINLSPHRTPITPRKYTKNWGAKSLSGLTQEELQAKLREIYGRDHQRIWQKSPTLQKPYRKGRLYRKGREGHGRRYVCCSSSGS